MRRHLDVTANTTFDFLDVRVFGDDWETETVAVLDVESPRGEETVTSGWRPTSPTTSGSRRTPTWFRSRPSRPGRSLRTSPPPRMPPSAASR
ncbi:hypothetical protein [Halorubrum gandharaense]